MARLGIARQGLASPACSVCESGCCAVGHHQRGRARQGKGWFPACAVFKRGLRAVQIRHGWLRQRSAWHGEARQSKARRGKDWFPVCAAFARARHAVGIGARRGAAVLGTARQGNVWQGKGCSQRQAATERGCLPVETPRAFRQGSARRRRARLGKVWPGPARAQSAFSKERRWSKRDKPF